MLLLPDFNQRTYVLLPLRKKSYFIDGLSSSSGRLSSDEVIGAGVGPSSLNGDQIRGLYRVSGPEIAIFGGHWHPGRSWIRSMPANENLEDANASGSSFLAPGFFS